MPQTDLSSYTNTWYVPGAGLIKRSIWYVVNAVFIKSGIPSSALRVHLLRLFGAGVGQVVIKPGVNIKYPWKLAIGSHVWIGEGVWIDNLDQVVLGDHVCLSQGAFLLCGNHNYSKVSFDLRTAPITLEAACWIGAKAVVCPGVIGGTHAVLTAGSVATRSLEPWFVYQGNPATKVKERKME
jgi:putative colanic acid biosynthesis acetyltransferase WcaF